MNIANKHKWCQNGKCPCPVREYVKQQTQCFSFEEIVEELMENEKMILACLMNQLALDAVCRDDELWCPDNPY